MSQALRAHIEQITPLSDAEFDYIFSHFKYRKLKKHQYLVQEGDGAPMDHYVISGLVKAYHTDPEGKEHILQFAMEDWWVSDYQAHVKGTPATLHISCLEPTEVLCISLAAKEKLCSELHQLEHFFRRKSNLGYIALQQRILSLLNNNAKDRYLQLMQQYPTLLQRVPKAQIAAYLGVSRETLSRLAV
jgi:CRP-like cAMP-binding protein